MDGWLTDNGEVDSRVTGRWQLEVDSAAVGTLIAGANVSQNEPGSGVAVDAQPEVRSTAQHFSIRPVSTLVQRVLPGVETAFTTTKSTPDLFPTSAESIHFSSFENHQEMFVYRMHSTWINELCMIKFITLVSDKCWLLTCVKKKIK